MSDHQRIAAYVECVGLVPDRLDRGRNVVRPPDLVKGNLEAERFRHRLDLAHFQHGVGKAGIGDDSQTSHAGNDLAQQFEALARNIGRHESKGR